MIIGQPGSGKSTLARLIGNRTGLPVFHIDRDVYWLPGWQERPKADQLRQVADIVAQDLWVFEGFNSSTFAMRAARADLVIWLDVGLGLRLWRVIRRSVQGRGKTRSDLAENCPERLHMLPEFIGFVLRTARPSRDKARVFFDAHKGPKIILRRLKDVDDFLEDLS